MFPFHSYSRPMKGFCDKQSLHGGAIAPPCVIIGLATLGLSMLDRPYVCSEKIQITFRVWKIESYIDPDSAGLNGKETLVTHQL
jgi:hypothetical protein